MSQPGTSASEVNPANIDAVGFDGESTVVPPLAARTLHPGTATGPLFWLTAPLSFWGGVSDEGDVIDVHHPQHGQSLIGQVVAMASGRGSSSSSSVLAELIRARRSPAAIIVREVDAIMVLGALVAAELYAVYMPIVQVDANAWDALPAADDVTVQAPAGTGESYPPGAIAW